jgi:hypothetical protein
MVDLIIKSKYMWGRSIIDIVCRKIFSFKKVIGGVMEFYVCYVMLFYVVYLFCFILSTFKKILHGITYHCKLYKLTGRGRGGESSSIRGRGRGRKVIRYFIP